MNRIFFWIKYTVEIYINVKSSLELYLLVWFEFFSAIVRKKDKNYFVVRNLNFKKKNNQRLPKHVEIWRTKMDVAFYYFKKSTNNSVISKLIMSHLKCKWVIKASYIFLAKKFCFSSRRVTTDLSLNRQRNQMLL